MGHTHHEKNFPWIALAFFWDLGQASNSSFWSDNPLGGCSNLVLMLWEWILISNAVFSQRVLLHTGRSTLSMQSASSSYLWIVEREMRSNCTNHFNSLSFVPFGCFSSSPSHACMYVCTFSVLPRLSLKIYRHFLSVFEPVHYLPVYCFYRGRLRWLFCRMQPLKFQCTQALEKPLFECLCFLCWAVYFAFFPHSSLASLWQLLFCMNYIPRGRKSPNSSSRFDSCLCD